MTIMIYVKHYAMTIELLHYWGVSQAILYNKLLLVIKLIISKKYVNLFLDFPSFYIQQV